MDRFQYDILTGRDNPNVPGGVFWILTSTGQQVGAQLLQALNALGAQGWEVIAIGDVGSTGRPEIVLKRRVQ